MKYTQDHEWINIAEGVATIGVTEFAQEQLGNIVFVELPNVGDVVELDQEAVVIESVKAAGEIRAPFTGVIVEVNELLHDSPEIVNDDPMGAGWLIKVQLEANTDLSELLDEDAYSALIGTL